MVKAMAKAKAMKGVTKALGGRKQPKSKGKVIPASNLGAQGKVLQPYDVDLNISDAAKNMNKFYRMQVVESTDKKKYWFVQQWGRTGTAGQMQIKGPSANKDAITKMMEQKFKQKSGKNWADRGTAGPGSGDSSARSGKGHYELTARLKKAGAKMSSVPGALQVSLMWDHTSKNVRNDLDLWVTCPSGEKIGYMHKKSKCGGELDVDRQQHAPKPVENIVWTKKAPKGNYTVRVQNFSSSHQGSMPFTVGIRDGKNEMELIEKVMPGKEKAWVTVKKFKH
eukprot:TRINITY_DN47207_c0_g1_i1.p1 TRINITY_DN47207_c0_g1~~TRINITY_DN47207_c0_g1_i1.p1  ORF type:complete len:280 (+),score=68.58 TRINITY_DN47207_c0_g1_i1:82-921(+)